MAPRKKGKAKKGKVKPKPQKVPLKYDLKGVSPKPKKIPPPPAIFKNEEIAFFKEMFKLFDEDGFERVGVSSVPALLRKIGFNPTGAELRQLLAEHLEDEHVDTVQFHELLFMIEAKMEWGDPFEQAVIEAMAALGHDENESKVIDFDILKEELFRWGEPLADIEFRDWIKVAAKSKTYDITTRGFAYEKFIDVMNAKDMKFIKEPINYFKLDQKTLAELAIKKAQELKEEQERKEAESALREEAKRRKMLAEGILLPDNNNNNNSDSQDKVIENENHFELVSETKTQINTE